MLINNIKISLRNLVKNKFYSTINILGLSIGIAASILIYRIVTYERSFNQDFKNYDRVVRALIQNKYSSGEESFGRGLPIPAMEILKKAVPQFVFSAMVAESFPIISVPNPTGGYPLKKFNIEQGKLGLYVSSDFFNVIDFKWLTPNQSAAMDDPDKIILTKSVAEKCYGTIQNAVNKPLLIDNLAPAVTIIGVIDDLPSNTDLPLVHLISYKTLIAHKKEYRYSEEWGSISSNNQFFALLKSKDQFTAAKAACASIGQHELSDKSLTRRILLQPMSEMHFNDQIGTSGTHITNPRKLLILTFIGILILVIACFNFINMANAQSITRAKEVGIRKTLGIRYVGLMSNFLIETAVLVLTSISLGILFAWIAAPILKQISFLPAGANIFESHYFFIFLIGLFVLLTFAAGIYPAMFMAGFQPIKVLKSGFDKSMGAGNSVRKTLVVMQFVIAFGLILSTVITLSQLSYIQNMDMGYNKDQIYTFYFNNDSLARTKLSSLKSDLQALSNVAYASLASDKPSSGNTWQSNWALDNSKEDAPFSISMKLADEDYLKLYQIKLLSGRWMHENDTMAEAVLNKTALSRLGINRYDSLLNKEIRLGGHTLKLVGVSDDYLSHSAHEPLEPLMTTTMKEYYQVISLKFKSGSATETIKSVQKLFEQYFPEQVFQGSFFDDDIQSFYRDDAQFTALCKNFAILAIVISCLGLLALATFSISRKVKEIGIRRVLGSSTAGIVQIISKEFMIMIALAFVLAAPLSWYLMQQWLQNFVYRVPIHGWMFVISFAIVLFISYLTVAWQAARAAWINPIKSLRTE